MAPFSTLWRLESKSLEPVVTLFTLRRFHRKRPRQRQSLSLLEQDLDAWSWKDDRSVGEGQTSIRIGQLEIVLGKQMHENLLHDSGRIPPPGTGSNLC